MLRDLDERDECPLEIVRHMCNPDKLGIQLLFVPEEYGGMGGSAFDVYCVCEQMARIDLGVATSVLATFLGSDPITFGATPEQKKKWLSKIADEGILFAYGATEPEAGSDLGALKTTADRVEEGGKIVGYKINGSKQWISNGGIADAYTMLANTPGGPSWFIVETGTKGFTHDKPEDKHGIRLSNTAALALNDVYVDADRLVGGVEGQGLIQAQDGLRLHARDGRGIWAGCGMGGARPRNSLLHQTHSGRSAAVRKAGLHPQADRAARSRVWKQAALTSKRRPSASTPATKEASIPKAPSPSTCQPKPAMPLPTPAFRRWAATATRTSTWWRRSAATFASPRIYEGTSEIMEMTISRDRWQFHLKTRGQHYHERAREFEALHAAHPKVGADMAALALHALAEVMEKARIRRLTRYQHILLRLGELIAYAECAGSLARRAALAAEKPSNEKANHRFDAHCAGGHQPNFRPRCRDQGGRRRPALDCWSRRRRRFRDGRV